MNRTIDFPASLLLVGAGKMGGSLLEGWLAEGFPGDRAAVADPSPTEQIVELCARTGVHLNPTALPFEPAALVLAIKPQMLEANAEAINAFIAADTVIVSILAGKTIDNLCRYLPRARAVIRTMPNLPASIGRGATGAFANEAVSARQRHTVDALLRTSGIVEWLKSEDLIDTVTAISGSGPAYIFHMVECLTAAGTTLGLPPDLAARLAQATVSGSSALLEQSGLDPAVLRENVTSPGGTTAAALNVLMAENGLDKLMKEAAAAAKRRAGELAG